MTHDAINSWIEKAKNSDAVEAAPQEIKVIRNKPVNRGTLIMEIAEKLRPWIMKMYEGVRDANGLVIQPAHVRRAALNVAQRVVHEYVDNA